MFIFIIIINKNFNIQSLVLHLDLIGPWLIISVILSLGKKINVTLRSC